MQARSGRADRWAHDRPAAVAGQLDGAPYGRWTGFALDESERPRRSSARYRNGREPIGEQPVYRFSSKRQRIFASGVWSRDSPVLRAPAWPVRAPFSRRGLHHLARRGPLLADAEALGRRAVHGRPIGRGRWSHAAGQPLGDLLQLPLVAVRVGEGRAAEVRAVFRVPASDRALVRVEMPDCADLNTPVDQILAGNVDVVNDQDQALERLRVGRQALAELIDDGEPGGVNCTPRVFLTGLKSMSRRHPRLS